MKKSSVLLLSLFLGLIIHAQQVNDPNAEVREAKGYHGIKVSNAFDVYLTQSAEEGVAVSASETKYRERIELLAVENYRSTESLILISAVHLI